MSKSIVFRVRKLRLFLSNKITHHKAQSSKQKLERKGGHTRRNINLFTLFINRKINTPIISINAPSPTAAYQVGKYPTITGPNPRYSPLIPSSIQILFKLAMIPLYSSPLGTPRPAPTLSTCCSELICACSLVLTTSRGHVIRLVRIPAQAPATAFFELGVRLCRSMLDGVDDGAGISAMWGAVVVMMMECPEEEGSDGKGGEDDAANVSTIT